MTAMRKVEKKNDDGTWEATTMKDLHRGEVFRMFEGDDNAPVKDPGGNTEFIADSEPYLVSNATSQTGEPISEPVWGVVVVANPGF